MNKYLQRILSLLCVMALALGTVCAVAENVSDVQYDTRIITVKWSDGDNYDGIRPGQVNASLGGASTVLNEENGWTGAVSVPSDTTNDWVYDSVEGYTATLRQDEISVLTYSRPIAPAVG